MSLALVVDVGTTNIKAGLVDPEGQVLSQDSRNLEIHRPEKGAAEHAPKEILKAFYGVVRGAVEGCEGGIEVLGLTGYQHGLLPLDDEGKPLTGMMTLMDERPKSVMDKLQRREDLSDIYRRTGCPPLFTYQLPKLLWLREEKPRLFESSGYFADIKSFLARELVGRFVTEPGIASSSQLFNINEFDWDDRLLKIAGVRRDQLPDLGAGGDLIGSLRPETAEEMNLGAGVEVNLGVYDGGAMVLGLGGVGGNYGVCNLGTTGMLRTYSDEPVLDDPEQRRLQTYSLFPGRWAVGGAINNAGVGLRWFRDNFQHSKSYEEIIAEASRVEPCSEGVFSLPYFTGERDPRIGNLASGSFFGLKDYHGKEHMVRAILEGVSYSLNFVREAMTENGIDFDRIRIGGSGASSDLWPRIISDVTELPVEKTLTEDTTLIGEAMLAYNTMGIYNSLAEAGEEMVKTGKGFTPDGNRARCYSEGYEFFKQLVSEFKEFYPLHDEKFSPGS
ncbi:gluconokinase [Candidatus Bipolaricaulota bacterium]|nr:gluconokinase [Candidatus Bipolaricaulota bacterium]